MINRVVLTGRPVRDPELRRTNSGTSVCSFTLAVERSFKSKNGERESDFISCVAWKKTAEFMSKYVKRGSVIGVDGRIQTRSYDNKDGQRVYVTEVVVENFSFLGGTDKHGQSNQALNSNEKTDPFASQKETGILDNLPF